MFLERWGVAMKVNAKITMLFSEEGMNIQLHDDDSTLTFLDIHLSQQEVMSAFSRLSYTPVTKCEVYQLEKIGMLHENKSFSFPFDERELPYGDRKKEAYKIALQQCPEGWEVDNYFSSQDSFFTDKFGVRGARCTIRRWTKKGESNEKEKS